MKSLEEKETLNDTSVQDNPVQEQRVLSHTGIRAWPPRVHTGVCRPAGAGKQAEAAHSAVKEEVGARGEKARAPDVIHKQLLWLRYRKKKVLREAARPDQFAESAKLFSALWLGKPGGRRQSEDRAVACRDLKGDTQGSPLPVIFLLVSEANRLDRFLFLCRFSKACRFSVRPEVTPGQKEKQEPHTTQETMPLSQHF